MHQLTRNVGNGMSLSERETIQNWVLEMVQQSSGGIKFVELITKLMMRANENKESWGTLMKRVSDAEWLEEAIEEMDQVEILRYSWQLSGELSREKMFVYTP